MPAELQKLARLNALELSYGRYESVTGDVWKLPVLAYVAWALAGTDPDR